MDPAPTGIRETALDGACSGVFGELYVAGSHLDKPGGLDCELRNRLVQSPVRMVCLRLGCVERLAIPRGVRTPRNRRHPQFTHGFPSVIRRLKLDRKGRLIFRV
jgi:hypothetical protein